jgi:HEAT repeat protein
MFSIDPYSREELLADAARLQGQEKIRAILRVALAMGDGFDAEYFAAISDAARDTDPQVRNAAAWSTGYLECPESMELLAEIAASDPHDEVRQSAKELLAEFS